MNRNKNNKKTIYPLSRPKGSNAKTTYFRPNSPDIDKQLKSVLGKPVSGKYAASTQWLKGGFRYREDFSTTLTTLTVTDQVFRANSLFDPDRTSAGHQPLSFDQYFLLYFRYHVYALTWHITFTTAADAYSMAVGVVNGTETFSTVNDFQTFCEAPQVRTDSSSYGGQTIHFYGHKMLHDFNGLGFRAYMTDDRFGATVLTNPIEIIDLHVMLYNPTGNSVLSHWNVDLKFHSVLHDPLLPDRSLLDLITPIVVKYYKDKYGEVGEKRLLPAVYQRKK